MSEPLKKDILSTAAADRAMNREDQELAAEELKKNAPLSEIAMLNTWMRDSATEDQFDAKIKDATDVQLQRLVVAAKWLKDNFGRTDLVKISQEQVDASADVLVSARRRGLAAEQSSESLDDIPVLTELDEVDESTPAVSMSASGSMRIKPNIGKDRKQPAA